MGLAEEAWPCCDGALVLCAQGRSLFVFRLFKTYSGVLILVLFRSKQSRFMVV